ncbi:MAG: DUF2550 domain-containing protein [Rhodococcus ruber]|nr:DUF2550 domain-containing protein [Rhodococcus ruber]
MIVLIVLVILLAVAVAAFLYRLLTLRGGGTAAILRRLPNGAGAGWRHGVIRYGERTLVFYKLSSLRPGPDSRLARQGVEDIVILEVQDGASSFEIALDSGALTAFLSWIESRPSDRSVRGRPN